MSFNRVRTAGLWIDGSTFGSAEIEQIDANLANALDMLDGGAYAPQSSITVGGAPGVFWEFAIPASFDDRVDVFGSFAAYSDVFLGGDGTESIVANGHVDLLGVITVGASGADAFTIEAFTTYNDLVTHNGAVYYYDNVTFAHGFDASGTILMHDGSVVIGDSGADALTVNAFTTFNDIEIHNGSAYFYGTPTFATPIEFDRVFRHRQGQVANQIDQCDGQSDRRRCQLRHCLYRPRHNGEPEQHHHRRHRR
jgi:hypothetical protein